MNKVLILTPPPPQVRESRAEREALTEEVASRDKENLGLGSRLAEAQDGVAQLKQLVENHQCSEREKNKRVGGWAGGRAPPAGRTRAPCSGAWRGWGLLSW